MRRYDQPLFRIQVKAASAPSKTRCISTIYSGSRQLYLLYLGRGFRHLGFWIVASDSVMRDGPLRHCWAPDATKGRSGSAKLCRGANRIGEMLTIAQPRLQRR